VEKYCSAWQATGDNMAHAYFILVGKATNTHTSCVIFIAFLCNNGCTNAPQCHILHTLPLLFPLEGTKEVCQAWYPDTFHSAECGDPVLYANLLPPVFISSCCNICPKCLTRSGVNTGNKKK